MAVVAKEDPLAKLRAFVSEKPEQIKSQLSEWTAKQPAWVEGLVQGGTGSMQVRRRHAALALALCGRRWPVCARIR